MIPAVNLLTTPVYNLIFFLKLINFIACSLKYLQFFFMQFLPLYTSYLFSMSLEDDIVDIAKSAETFTPSFVVDDFLILFLHQFIFSIQNPGFE